MKEYKDGDKVVIKLVGADEMQELTGRKLETVMSCPILGKLEDFQPAQEKNKIEFSGDVARKIYKINGFQGPSDCDLYEKLIIPSEDIEEDVRIVQIGDRNLWKHKAEYLLVEHLDINNENYYFTKKETIKINKLPQFKYIDLVAAWEDGE